MLFSEDGARSTGHEAPLLKPFSSNRRRWIPVACLTGLSLFLACGAGYGEERDGSARVSPRNALLMSTVVPGWGQLATGHRVKGAVCFAAGAGLLGKYFIEDRRADRALERAGLATTNSEYVHFYNEYSRHFDRKNDVVWWAVFFWLYAMIDAYVDAHLVGFDKGFDGEPQGDRLRPWGEVTQTGFRLGIRIGA